MAMRTNTQPITEKGGTRGPTVWVSTAIPTARRYFTRRSCCHLWFDWSWPNPAWVIRLKRDAVWTKVDWTTVEHWHPAVEPTIIKYVAKPLPSKNPPPPGPKR